MANPSRCNGLPPGPRSVAGPVRFSQGGVLPASGPVDRRPPGPAPRAALELAGQEGKPIKVMALTNADSVTLTLNGRSWAKSRWTSSTWSRWRCPTSRAVWKRRARSRAGSLALHRGDHGRARLTAAHAGSPGSRRRRVGRLARHRRRVDKDGRPVPTPTCRSILKSPGRRDHRPGQWRSQLPRAGEGPSPQLVRRARAVSYRAGGEVPGAGAGPRPAASSRASRPSTLRPLQNGRRSPKRGRPPRGSSPGHRERGASARRPRGGQPAGELVDILHVRARSPGEKAAIATRGESSLPPRNVRGVCFTQFLQRDAQHAAAFFLELDLAAAHRLTRGHDAESPRPAPPGTGLVESRARTTRRLREPRTRPGSGR